MFMIALLIISMAVALPKVAADIQRDRELETYHRGMQYRRAIQLYFKKFQRYPPNMDALVKTNEIRFLRKKYIDPTTGKDDWKPILYGQNKTPMAMGFFGQPLGGIGFGGGMMAGTGPAGGNGIAGASTIGGSTFGSSNTMGSTFGSNNTMGGSTFGSSNTMGGSTFGSGSTIGTSSTTNQTGATDANGNPTDPNSGSNIGTPAAGTGNQASGPVFGGGAGMIGVSPASEKESIFVYKKKNHYNEWEFLYSPQSDMGMMGMMPPPGIQPSTPGVGAPGTTFSPTGGAGGVASPTQPAPTQPTPTQPQQ
jgi:type II secretory pathway pseudopilin PulG